jgi:hypothetical protein
MSDEEHSRAILEANNRKSLILLTKIVDWYDNNFMEQSFAEIMVEIREHLKENDQGEENEKD